jgi:uncharacterized LabA/DUF88 family protein
MRPLLFMPLQTNVYVDGFNLYYGCMRHSPYKWLDLSKLCSALFPKNHIQRIGYFTALLTPRPNDPRQGQRQQTYLRALRTIPNLSITYGHFLASRPWMMKADLSGKVQVLKTEEKGSDVNLASHVLTDAYESDSDVVVVISNDSDLAYPLDYVKRRLGKIVGVVNPHERASFELQSIATFYKRIRPSALAASQFSPILTDKDGEFHRPPEWINPHVT